MTSATPRWSPGRAAGPRRSRRRRPASARRRRRSFVARGQQVGSGDRPDELRARRTAPAGRARPGCAPAACGWARPRRCRPSAEEKSRFQCLARLAVDSSICCKRNRSTPATSSLAMSPVIVSGSVPGSGCGAGPAACPAAREHQARRREESRPSRSPWNVDTGLQCSIWLAPTCRCPKPFAGVFRLVMRARDGPYKPEAPSEGRSSEALRWRFRLVMRARRPTSLRRQRRPMIFVGDRRPQRHDGRRPGEIQAGTGRGRPSVLDPARSLPSAGPSGRESGGVRWRRRSVPQGFTLGSTPPARWAGNRGARSMPCFGLKGPGISAQGESLGLGSTPPARGPEEAGGGRCSYPA